MPGNFLEQLVAEWYEFNGYFVRKNVLVGKRKEGGYECELDIVAFNPERKELHHIEPSMDTNSWKDREKRYKKKFDAGKKHIPKLFKGLKLPSKIKQIALFGHASDKTYTSVGGGEVLTLTKFLEEIFAELTDGKKSSSAIPESYQILRAYQFVCSHPTVMKNRNGASPE